MVLCACLNCNLTTHTWLSRLQATRGWRLTGSRRACTCRVRWRWRPNTTPTCCGAGNPSSSVFRTTPSTSTTTVTSSDDTRLIKHRNRRMLVLHSCPPFWTSKVLRNCLHLVLVDDNTWQMPQFWYTESLCSQDIFLYYCCCYFIPTRSTSVFCVFITWPSAINQFCFAHFLPAVLCEVVNLLNKNKNVYFRVRLDLLIRSSL